MKLRNSLMKLEKVKQTFNKYNRRSDDQSSYLEIAVLSDALSDATDMQISQNQVDNITETMQCLLNEEGNDNSIDKIGISEFLFILQSLEAQMEASSKEKNVEELDSTISSMTQNQKSILLDNISGHLYPLRKLLRIQLDETDAEIRSSEVSQYDDDFDSAFLPGEMLLLALVSHNEMKSTMKHFVISNRNILKKFRLTGTNSTMTMLKDVFGDDPDIVFGPSCASGPLGGDAELSALMAQGALGGIIFFQDPMTSHPHQADIESFCRLALVHNTLVCHNPATAIACMDVFRLALKGEGKPALIPSFFFPLMSPSVPAYKHSQHQLIQSFKEDGMSATGSDTPSVISIHRRSQLVGASPEPKVSFACREIDCHAQVPPRYHKVSGKDSFGYESCLYDDSSEREANCLHLSPQDFHQYDNCAVGGDYISPPLNSIDATREEAAVSMAHLCVSPSKDEQMSSHHTIISYYESESWRSTNSSNVEPVSASLCVVHKKEKKRSKSWKKKILRSRFSRFMKK